MAAELCGSHPDSGPAALRGYACGGCWEQAVRDDERRLLEPGYDAPTVPASAVRLPKHFAPSHVLAPVAARMCQAHTRSGTLIGRVGCGPCWEAAIRADERVVVEYELPRELAADPHLVDEVAVRLACVGEPVALTPLEQAMVAQRRERTAPPAPWWPQGRLIRDRRSRRAPDVDLGSDPWVTRLYEAGAA